MKVDRKKVVNLRSFRREMKNNKSLKTRIKGSLNQRESKEVKGNLRKVVTSIKANLRAVKRDKRPPIND